MGIVEKYKRMKELLEWFWDLVMDNEDFRCCRTCKHAENPSAPCWNGDELHEILYK